jgi:hypothetical protein
LHTSNGRTAHLGLLIGLLTLVLLVSVPLRPAAAQGEIPLQSVRIDLWPEYDRPSLLVIYHITLPAQVSLPIEIALRIPAASGKPNAVAASQPDGGLINLPYEQEMAGTWTRLVFKATTHDLQVEYYDVGLTKVGERRSFTYEWPGDYAVNALTVQVQQPKAATNLTITPSLGGGSLGEDGLMYYRAEVGSLAGGQPFSLQVAYDNASGALSTASLPVYPAAPLNADTPGRMRFDQPLAWALGGLGLLLLGSGATWYWLSGRKTAPPRRTQNSPRRHRRANPTADRPNPTLGAAQPADGLYCANCGNRASASDRFCRTCGAALHD